MASDKPLIGVVGLGTMGLGIAQVYASAGFGVRATDAVPAVRDSVLRRLADTLAPRVASGKLTPELRDETLTNLTVHATPEDLHPCALIIEAIAEDAAAKTAVFLRLQAAAPKAILASNTSSLAIFELSKGLNHPENLLGLHFFNPAPVMRLVELIPHRGSTETAITLARSLTEAAGKTVITSPDRPGFIVNRCARPYYGEALALIEEGRTPSDIDAAMLAAGYRIGPLSLIDLIGADINLAATNGLYAAMHQHPRYHPFAALRTQVANGNLGRKTGQGFLYPAVPGPAPADARTIALRIEATLINEACWLSTEGTLTQAHIDTALRLAMNFPRGPFEALATHGKARILTTLQALESTAPPHLKTRYLPAPYLLAR